MKRALITGITGPDGSYLAKLPLKGYVAAGSPAEVYFCWATRNYSRIVWVARGQQHLVQSRITASRRDIHDS